MSNPGKRVVFGVEDDQAAAGTVFGREARIDPVCVRRHLKPELAKDLNEDVVSSMLFISEFRVGMDLIVSVAVVVRRDSHQLPGR